MRRPSCPGSSGMRVMATSCAGSRRKRGGTARRGGTTRAPGRRSRRGHPAGSRASTPILAALLAQDLANVEAGLYPLPDDHDGSLLTLLRRSRLFFDDLPDDPSRGASATAGARGADRSDRAAGGRTITCRISTFNLAAGCRRIRPTATTRRSRCCLRVRANAMRRQALPPLARSLSQDAISAIAAHRHRLRHGAAFSISPSRRGRGFPSLGLDLSDAYYPARARSPPPLVARRSRRRQRGGDPGARRELRRGDVHLHVPRIAAGGAPQRHDRRIAPAFSSRADVSCCSIRCSAGTCRITTGCSNGFRRTITSRITAATSARTFPRSRGGCGLTHQRDVQGVRVEGDGVR